jgi:hypothetical protein
MGMERKLGRSTYNRDYRKSGNSYWKESDPSMIACNGNPFCPNIISYSYDLTVSKMT